MKLANTSIVFQVARIAGIPFVLCAAAACGGRAGEDVVAERFPDRGGEVFVRAHSASAAFWSSARRATTTRYANSCSVYAWDSCGMQPQAENMDVGVIDIVGTKTPVSLEFASDTDGYRSVFLDNFVPGETISIRSSGKAPSPAFSANIVAPAPIRVTQPEWPVWTSNGPEGRPTLRFRARDGLELQWEAAPGSGRVTATFFVATPENASCPGRRRMLECAFARADLRATIPADALLAIAAVPGAAVQLSVGSENFETVQAPELPVRVTAFRGAATSAPNTFGRPLSDEAWALVVFQ
jgi:hypothetical protein